MHGKVDDKQELAKLYTLFGTTKRTFRRPVSLEQEYISFSP